MINVETMTGDEFRTALNDGMRQLNLDDDRAALLFDVSVPSVRRWRAGKTEPFPVVKRLVLDVLRLGERFNEALSEERILR